MYLLNYLYIISCDIRGDSRTGTVFTHDISNGATRYWYCFYLPTSLLMLKVDSIQSLLSLLRHLTNTGGVGNTTGPTGIGTNITLKFLKVSVVSALLQELVQVTTVTLSTTPSDMDIVSFGVHYNGQQIQKQIVTIFSLQRTDRIP